MRQRGLLSAPVLFMHMLGPDNQMVDFNSRLYNKVLRITTNSKFLYVFNSIYPLQAGVWHNEILPSATILAVIS